MIEAPSRDSGDDATAKVEFPVYFLHEDDFEWWCGMVDGSDTVASAATKLGAHAIGSRVPDKGLPLGIVLIEDTGSKGGQLLNSDVRVGDVITPLALLKIVWLSKGPERP